MASLSIASFSPDLHLHTPTLSTLGPLGVVVRTVKYCRSEVGGQTQARIERNEFDAAQRKTAQWDARLWAKAQAGEDIEPNRKIIYDLGARVLASKSVDAGWQVSLFGSAAQELEVWDSRHNRRATRYDEQLRPVAVFEQAQGGDEYCVERLIYGGNDQGEKNSCGQLIRHDDPAGSLEILVYGLTGQALDQKRRFLTSLDTPHWPDSAALLGQGKENSTTWTYDASGSLLTQVDAGNHTQRQTWTIDGQLKTVSLQISGQNEQVLASSIEYDAFGNATRERYGNDVTHIAEYDPSDMRLRRLKAQRKDGTLVQDSVYELDPIGNVIRFEDRLEPVKYFANRRTDGISTYSYDTLGQLTMATGRKSADASITPGLPDLLPLTGGGDTSVLKPYTQTYTYDTGGNLLELRHPGSDTPNRVMAVAASSNHSLLRLEGEPDFAQGFDANGNQQWLAPGQPMLWNVRNQLMHVVQVRRPEGIDDDERYIYGANNLRVRKVSTALAKNITHRAEVCYLPGFERRTDAAKGEELHVICVFVGRSQVRVLHWPNNNAPEGITNNQVRYQVGDYLNSAALELDDSARVISREGFFPFGGIAWQACRSEIEASYKVIRYSGQERDATGLLYYGYRYYAPWFNRWINPDPAGDIDGLNLYGMLKNNPITLKDEGGLGPEEDARYIHYLSELQRQNPGISLDHYQSYLTSNFKNEISAADAKRVATLYKRHAEAVKRGKTAANSSDVLTIRDVNASEELDYIWATNIGATYLKGLPTSKNVKTEVFRELSIFKENMFKGKEALKARIEMRLNRPQQELMKAFEEKIEQERVLVPKLFRGTPDIGFAEAAKNKFAYSPGFPLAASSSEKAAEWFRRGGVMLEIVGKAAPIQNIFDKADEEEYVFSKTATFQVTAIGPNRYKLTQMRTQKK